MAILELSFKFFLIWRQIRNKHTWKLQYANFHKNWKFFVISFRHIGSTILNFENLTACLKSATQILSVYRFSWKLNNFQIFGPSYWNHHFEFSKSDRRLVLSIPENTHIQIFRKMNFISKFRSTIFDLPYWISKIWQRIRYQRFWKNQSINF